MPKDSKKPKKRNSKILFLVVYASPDSDDEPYARTVTTPEAAYAASGPRYTKSKKAEQDDRKAREISTIAKWMGSAKLGQILVLDSNYMIVAANPVDPFTLCVVSHVPQFSLQRTDVRAESDRMRLDEDDDREDDDEEEYYRPRKKSTKGKKKTRRKLNAIDEDDCLDDE